MSVPTTNPADGGPVRSFEDLRTTGLLWLINRVVFHPRGFAFGLVRNELSGEIDGWRLHGDGAEPWRFEGVDEDARFQAAESTLAVRAPMAQTNPPVDPDPQEAQ